MRKVVLFDSGRRFRLPRLPWGLDFRYKNCVFLTGGAYAPYVVRTLYKLYVYASV